jgi:hypothetical protein
MTTPRQFWFPAKSHGLGWGPPRCWQGWVVLITYLLALSGGAFVILTKPDRAPIFCAYAFALSAQLIVICWLKGEPLSWRWGKK